MDNDQQRLINLLKTLLNNDDITIIKYVIESIIEELEEKSTLNKDNINF